MRVSERLIGRLLAASLIGGALGYAFGASVAHDAERGRTITMKQYVDDFDRYRSKLETSSVPIWGAVLTCIVMALGLFGAYEGLGFLLTKTLSALSRGDATGFESGPAP